MTTTDEQWMHKALALAELAYDQNETPVGALIVKNNQIVSEAYNTREASQLATDHAELVAIQKACAALETWRLTECTLYVTLEPCIMCSGAILQSRIPRVVFGCHDPKGGGAGSLYDLLTDARLNHRCEVTSGVLEQQCSEILTRFFRSLRASRKSSE